MAKKNQSGLVPVMRFPEFRRLKGWEYEPMERLYAFKGNNSLSRDKLNYTLGSVKNIHYGDIHTKFPTHFDMKFERVPYINSSEDVDTFKAENFCAKGDVVFADASEDLEDIGKAIEIIELNGQPTVSGLHTILARQTESNIVLGFAGHLFKSSLVRIQIQNESQGTKVLGLSVGRLSKVIIPFPTSHDEQRKIADCLTSLDAVIAAQRKKVEALKTYKRGLMQRLFPQEGEIQPLLRFPGSAVKKAWRRQKISLVMEKLAMPVSVKPEEMYREIGIRSHGKGIFHKEARSGEQIGDKRVFHVVQDALVLNIVFAWEQAVATTSKNEIGMIASHRFPMYVAKSRQCDVRLLREFFLTKAGKYLLWLASPGGAGRNKTLGQKEFENLEISLPVDVKEQSRIADCLASADQDVVTENAKLLALKAHKKGLMQQLFPSSAKD